MLKIKDGIGWKPDPGKPGWLISAMDPDYVAEIERLRAALTRIDNEATCDLAAKIAQEALEPEQESIVPTPFEKSLLARAAAPGGLIPSDNMGLRMGEISSAGALTRRGLLQEIRHEKIPGPPSGPGPWTITDAGRIALGENPSKD